MKSLARSFAAAVAMAVTAGYGVQATAAEVGVTDTTIKIGMFGPLTGSWSFFGHPVQMGALMVYKEINEKGGIHGRKIEVVQVDGACDPAKTLAAAKRLIHRDKVFMLNAGICSPATMAAKEEIVSNKVPQVLFAASLDAITAPVSRYVFTAAPTGSYDGKSMADFIKSIPGVKKVAIVRHSDEWAKAKYEPFMKAMQDAKIEVVANETIEKNVTDATPQILAMKRANPDAIALITVPAESSALVRDAHRHGLNVPMVGNNSLIDLAALAERAGGAAAAQKTYVMASLIGPLGSAELAPWEALLKKHFPDQKPTADVFYGTVSAVAIVEALKRAGKDLTRDKFIDALESLKDFETGIAPCKVTFSAANHQGCQSQTAWKLVGGKITVVGDKWRDVK
jgi:branched-chain amino acid transport system substrate-binding protein